MSCRMSPCASLCARVAAFALIGIGCLFLTQCGDDTTTTPNHGTSIDENIAGLSHLDQATPFAERPVGDPDVATYERDGRTYECNEQEYEVAAAFDQQVTLNPTSDILWPGALLDGATIPNGEYVPIVADRAPLTISISLINIEGAKSKTVQDPKLSSMREAIGEILAQEVTGATDARVTFEIKDVHSESQLDLALGVTYRSGLTTVKNQFNFSDTEVLSRTLVKFLQVYYTIDVDVPQKPSDLFAPSVTWASLDPQISGAVSPMYVSSIAYGRMALFSMESKYSSTQVQDALNVSIQNIKQGGDGNFDESYKTVLQQSTMKATIIGGSGASAVQVVNGFEGLKEYMTQGGNYNKDTAAAPLAYQMRYLCDNGTCQVVMAQNYVVRTCGELRPGHYAARNTAPYQARLMVNYMLDGEPVHWESDLLTIQWNPSDSYDVPARATDVWVEARSIWLAETVRIFRYPASGSMPRPEVKCWEFTGFWGNNPEYTVLEECDF